MARAILAGILWFAGIASAAPCDSKINASLAVRTEVQVLQQTLKSSPFYGELALRFGKPNSCHMEFEGETISVFYTFRGQGKLTGRINRGIESSEQRLDVPRIDRQKAIALLQAAERKSYRPKGCGIRWRGGEQEGAAASREIVYRGTSCNCQARLIYEGRNITSVVLKSTC